MLRNPRQTLSSLKITMPTTVTGKSHIYRVCTGACYCVIFPPEEHSGERSKQGLKDGGSRWGSPISVPD